MKARLARRAPRATLALVLGLLAVASTTVSSTTVAAPTITPRVIATFPHDPAAFTQGLVLQDGFLFESTGLTGESSLRRVDRRTGEVLQSIALPAEHFGEGLALFDGRFVQLTWMNGLATLRDQTSFAELGTFSYDTEGWGLCHDGRRFIMTDGSDRLTFRDSTTFEVLGSVPVQEDGVAFPRLNELECVGGRVLANVWLTDTILHIDPETGNVLTKIDAAGLLTPAEANAADVLNGIAFDAETGHYLLTGKLWPKLFEVELDLAASLTATPDAGHPPALPTSNPPIADADAGAEPSAPAHSLPPADAGSGLGEAPSPDRAATPSPTGGTPRMGGDSGCSMRAASAEDTSSARARASLAAGLLAVSIARRRRAGRVGKLRRAAATVWQECAGSLQKRRESATARALLKERAANMTRSPYAVAVWTVLSWAIGCGDAVEPGALELPLTIRECQELGGSPLFDPEDGRTIEASCPQGLHFLGEFDEPFFGSDGGICCAGTEDEGQ